MCSTRTSSSSLLSSCSDKNTRWHWLAGNRLQRSRVLSFLCYLGCLGEVQPQPFIPPMVLGPILLHPRKIDHLRLTFFSIFPFFFNPSPWIADRVNSDKASCKSCTCSVCHGYRFQGLGRDGLGPGGKELNKAFTSHFDKTRGEAESLLSKELRMLGGKNWSANVNGLEPFRGPRRSSRLH